jgi:predicted patatin/cPLA2 family phospholipase
MPTWADPDWNRALISRRRLLRGRPMVDVQGLVERDYENLSPGLFAAALAAPTELHPLATSVESGEAVDLHDRIQDLASLRTAVRASATLPVIGGAPVALDGGRFVDAGLTAAIPFQAAVDGGATHILVLRSRLEGETTVAPSGLGARITARALRRVDPAVARAFLTRAERELAVEALLARYASDPALRPHTLSLRPAPGSPVPSRLDRDVAVVAAALEAGRVAAHAALGT